MNLLADLDQNNGKEAIDPHMGTPTHRTRRDNFSTNDMIAFESWLANRVRDLAGAAGLPTMVSTGHAIPRVDAEHLRQSYHAASRDWSPDTKAQFVRNLIDTAACCELASVHYYAGHGARWGISNPNSTEPLTVAFFAIEKDAHLRNRSQTLYVGEFGDPNPGPRAFSLSVLQLLSTVPIRVATVWVWMFYQFSSTSMAPYSISPDPVDDNILQAMRAVNSLADGPVSGFG